MILDHPLVAAGDEDEMLDAGFTRLVDHVLDQRAVDHRQHFLGHGLGGRQEAGAETGDREDGFADGHMISMVMEEYAADLPFRAGREEKQWQRVPVPAPSPEKGTTRSGHRLLRRRKPSCRLWY